MNLLKTTESSSGTRSQNGERSLHYGDPRRADGGGGAAVVTVWPRVRNRSAKPEEDLLPEPQKMDKAMGYSPGNVRMLQPGLSDDDFRPCCGLGIFHIAIGTRLERPLSTSRSNTT